MVEIRSLRTFKQLAIPAKPRLKRPPQYKIVVRYNRDFPPPTPQPTPCRLWQGVEGTDGYGRRKVHENGTVRSMSMHRWVMETYVGRRLKPSEVILHACDNRLCYRLDHLSIGTVQDNNADMLAKGRAVKPPVNRFVGECHPMAKLTAAQVRDIRGHRLSGLAVKTIAEMYGVGNSTIRRICSGQTWAEFGNGQYVKPPTRDLIAEATYRIEEAAKPPPPPPPPPSPIGKIRPVKPIRKDL